MSIRIDYVLINVTLESLGDLAIRLNSLKHFKLIQGREWPKVGKLGATLSLDKLRPLIDWIMQEIGQNQKLLKDGEEVTAITK